MSRLKSLVASAVLIALVIGVFLGGVLSSNRNADSKFSSDDLMFAQMMIPHHEQAVVMSELALTNSMNPEVIALATAIRDAQAPEIKLMQSWLAGSDSNSHAGHDMPMSGMLDDAQLAALKAVQGKDFDRLFLQGMIGHHEGALMMLKIVDKSKNAEVKVLSEEILKSQSAEIKLMKSYLTTLTR
jgi:uncharacterized protein (DUF305 family)